MPISTRVRAALVAMPASWATISVSTWRRDNGNRSRRNAVLSISSSPSARSGTRDCMRSPDGSPDALGPARSSSPGQNASVVSQGMDHDSGVLARLDNLVEIADRAVADRIGQRSIVPDSCHFASSRKRPTRSEAVMSSLHATVISGFWRCQCHVFDETGFAAACRAFEHHRHARLMGRLEQRDLVANRLVIGLLANAIVVQIGL